MKNKIVFLLLLPLLSCNSNSPFNMFSENNDNPINENVNYIKVQKQIQTSYSLLKALNTGAISQEEYDKLKTELFNI